VDKGPAFPVAAQQHRAQAEDKHHSWGRRFQGQPRQSGGRTEKLRCR
jgi:hypothetical protein